MALEHYEIDSQGKIISKITNNVCLLSKEEVDQLLSADKEKYLRFQIAIAENIQNYSEPVREHYFNRLATKKLDPSITGILKTKPLHIKLELFLCLSKKEYVKNNESYSTDLGNKILKNIKTEARQLDTKGQLMLLSCIDKHNKPGVYDEPRKIVLNNFKTELNNYFTTKVVPKNLWFFNAERRAVRRLEFAANTSGFFQSYRQRLLEDALSGKDKDASAIVSGMQQKEGKKCLAN